MKFASWNINSINLRKEAVLNWIITQDIDVLGLQEIKCEEANFPKSFFTDNNYFVEVIGQKGFNGVAIISKIKAENVKKGFYGCEDYDLNIENFLDQKRLISAEINGIKIINVYVPNGSSLDSDKFKYKIN